MTAPWNPRRSARKSRTWLWAVIAAIGVIACLLAVGVAAMQSEPSEVAANEFGTEGDGGPTGGGSPTGTPATRPRKCTVSANLVPSCGVWWGATPGAFGGQPPQQALSTFEQRIGRTLDIYHGFHKGTQIFPTPAEIAIARQPGKNRKLLLNWKPDDGQSWAQVANGSMDAHIDRLAAHIKADFPEKFWLVIHHEPEEEIKHQPNSGYTPRDYSRMFRRVVQRFRRDGVKNVLFTVAYRGYSNWTIKPWFMQLYPGDDVVDWVAFDPYVKTNKTPDLASLIDKAAPLEHDQGYPGFYTWSQTRMPGKPLMMAEWGVLYDHTTAAERAAFFDSVRRQLKDFPRLKAMVYFEATGHGGLCDSQIHTDRQTLSAFRRLSRDRQVNP